MKRINRRDGINTWNNLYTTDKENWLVANKYSFLFAQDSFNALPKSIQEHFSRDWAANTKKAISK